MRSSLKIAWANVRATRWQSMLTILGVVIGVVSVVLVIGIGEGVKYQVTQQVDQFGKDLITVRPGHERSTHGFGVNTDILFGMNNAGNLSEKDVSALTRTKGVRLVAPLSLVAGRVSSPHLKIENSLVLATNANLPDALSQDIKFGEFFDEKSSDTNTAVLGQSVAKALFDEEAPLGHTFMFRGEEFIVRGVFDEFDSTPLSPATDFNSAIFIPEGLARSLVDGRLQPDSILVKPTDKTQTTVVQKAVTNRLLQLHGGEQDFMVLNHDQNVAASSVFLNLITTMVMVIAIISLVVGGVGIMNIMLAMVTERTHEIGVRKAIGATNRQILNQFLLESVVLSVFGGVVGVLMSMLTILLLRLYTDVEPILTWHAVLIATGASLVIGVVFGTIPALRAAHRDPIEALRNE